MKHAAIVTALVTASASASATGAGAGAGGDCSSECEPAGNPCSPLSFYFDVPSRNIDHRPVNHMIYREIKVDALHCELGQTG